MKALLLTASINLAIMAAIFVPLERVFPARRDQRIFRPRLALDAVFFFAQYLLTGVLALRVIGFVHRVLQAHLPLHRIALGQSPWWLQLVLAIALGDFVVYWFHRACHKFDFLWHFHAVHHSAEHLDWVAAHREHPLDGIATALCMNLPAMMLGLRIELLAGVVVFRGVWAIFVHSNVRLPLGPLRWVLGAPELHHWHHVRHDDARAVTHNFANLAPWLDALFGTHHCPELEGDESFPLGLAEPQPTSYLGLVLKPFIPRDRPLPHPPHDARTPAPSSYPLSISRAPASWPSPMLLDRAFRTPPPPA